VDASMIIRFLKDCYIVVQDTIESMPYSVEYKEGEIEQADLLESHSGTIHVQFGDGSVGWIKERHVNTEEDED
jgi:hypothetical protein